LTCRHEKLLSRIFDYIPTLKIDMNTKKWLWTNEKWHQKLNICVWSKFS